MWSSWLSPVIVPPIRNGICRFNIDFRILSTLTFCTYLSGLLGLLVLQNNKLTNFPWNKSIDGSIGYLSSAVMLVPSPNFAFFCKDGSSFRCSAIVIAFGCCSLVRSVLDACSWIWWYANCSLELNIWLHDSHLYVKSHRCYLYGDYRL